MGNCIIARNGGGMETYSTEEQVVGTWIDGKPIYRKLIFNNSTIGSIIVSLDIDTFIQFIGWYRDDNADFPIPWNDFNSTYSSWCFGYYEKNKKTLTIRSNKNFTGYGWAEYTKTTD